MKLLLLSLTIFCGLTSVGFSSSDDTGPPSEKIESYYDIQANKYAAGQLEQSPSIYDGTDVLEELSSSETTSIETLSSSNKTLDGFQDLLMALDSNSRETLEELDTSSTEDLFSTLSESSKETSETTSVGNAFSELSAETSSEVTDELKEDPSQFEDTQDKVCSNLHVPMLSVSREQLGTFPSEQNTLIRQNFSAYLDDLLRDSEARADLITLAPIRNALREPVLSTTSVLSLTQAYSEVLDTQTAKQLFCTALLPISETLVFSEQEAADFYYTLSQSFFYLQQYNLAQESLSLALTYVESNMYYEYYLSLLKQGSDPDALGAVYVAYSDFLLRNSGPAAALELLERGLTKYPASRRISSRLANILTAVSPKDAAAFRQ